MMWVVWMRLWSWRSQDDGEQVRESLAAGEKWMRDAIRSVERETTGLMKNAYGFLREWNRCAPRGKTGEDLLEDVKERLYVTTDADFDAIRAKITDIKDQVSTIRQNIVDGDDVMKFREDGYRLQKQLGKLRKGLKYLDTKRIEYTLRDARKK